MNNVLYLLAAEVDGNELWDWAMERFMPAGATCEPMDGSTLIAFQQREVALAVRDAILQKHPNAVVRIFAQPDWEDEADLLNEENPALDADGIYVAKDAGNGQWQGAVAYRLYCKKIPVHVRRQLFASKQTRNSLPEMAPTPYGEIRC